MRKRLSLTAIPAVIGAGLLLATVAQATMILDWTVEDLTQHADAVVVGRVTRQWSAVNPNTHVPYQHIEVEVSDAIRGVASVGERLHVVQVGGDNQGIRMTVAGTAQFTDGERVVLFLEKRMAEGVRVEDHWLLTGMFQGKLTVEETEHGPEAVRPTRVKGVLLVDERGRPAAAHAAQAELRIPLSQLKTRVIQTAKEVK